MTMPVAVVRAFNLTSDTRLKVSYEDEKLIIDLHPDDTTNDTTGKPSPGYVGTLPREVAA
jgi:hypothetical protein